MFLSQRFFQAYTRHIPSNKAVLAGGGAEEGGGGIKALFTLSSRRWFPTMCSFSERPSAARPVKEDVASTGGSLPRGVNRRSPGVRLTAGGGGQQTAGGRRSSSNVYSNDKRTSSDMSVSIVEVA